jgi:hypothetical protein
MRAQIYLGISGGYGIPFAKETIGKQVQLDSAYSAITAIRGSFGAGQNYTLYGGYTLNEKMGLELGVNYLSGKKYSSSRTDNNYHYSYKEENQVTSLRLNASVRFVFGKMRLNYYIKSGIITGLFSRKNTNFSQTHQQYTYEKISYQNKGLMLGVTGAAGMCFHFNESISAFLETNVTGMHWSPEKGKVLKYEINGVNSLSTLPTGPQPYRPKEGKYFMPMSAVGFSVGVHFNF